ncbi:MAG: pyridoxamine 5'-phosphate oxidase family protein [Candidatus Omnitrophota bacterium]
MKKNKKIHPSADKTKRNERQIEMITSEEKDRILQDLVPFLSPGKFINVATCSLERMPNVAPKLVVKTEKNIIYFIDYIIGRTFINLKENPRISISFIDQRTLTGYQLNGTVDIIDRGSELEGFVEDFQKIKTGFTVERILFNLRSGGKTSALEFFLPEKFAVLKVKVIEIVEISSSGGLKSKFALG